MVNACLLRTDASHRGHRWASGVGDRDGDTDSRRMGGGGGGADAVNVQVSAAAASPHCTTTSSASACEPACQPVVPYEQGGVRYACVAPPHLQEVRRLHEELFPVVYARAFYESLLTDEMDAVVALDAEAAAAAEAEDPEGDDDGRMPSVVKGSRLVLGVSTTRVTVDTDWLCRTTRTGYLSTFGVTGAARRRRIGSSLLDISLRRLRDAGCGTVHLHVLTDNHTAIDFYKRHGFRTMRTLESYYLIHQTYRDAFHMQLEVHPPKPSVVSVYLSLVLSAVGAGREVESDGYDAAPRKRL